MTEPAEGEAPNMTHGEAYFLYHSIGIYPGKESDLAAATAEFAAAWAATDDGQWGRILPLRQAFIDRWRGLIGAPEGTVTTAENVTGALHMLITALPEGRLRGKRVLVAGDCFPSLHFLLNGLAARLGFTLETVPPPPGQAWVEDKAMIARWGPDVGLCLLTWVSSTNSHRCDLAPLVAHGRKMGSLIGVDITQAAGLLPFNVDAPTVDFVVSTSLKWMCGTPGAGILYAARPVIEECRPELRGWFSQDDPFRWDLDKFAFAGDARRFDNGTPGIVAAVASLPALNWHAGQDHAALLAHNRALSDRILDGLAPLPLKVVSPLDAAARGGSVMARLPAARAPEEVLARLRAAGIFADCRGPILRLSPGVMTTTDGVEHLLAELTAALA